MKLLFKVLIVGFAILLFGCSKKVETTEPSKSDADEKTSTEVLKSEGAKQPNIVNVPFDFKGAKIGMKKDKVKNIFPKLIMMKSVLGCSEGTNFTCKDKLTLINETPSDAVFDFVDGKLDSVMIVYNNKIFKDLFCGLRSKYGEPVDLLKSDSENSLINSEDNLIKKIDSSTPLALSWENANGEMLTITNLISANVEGLTKGSYLLQSKEQVTKFKKNIDSNKQREKFKRKDL